VWSLCDPQKKPGNLIFMRAATWLPGTHEYQISGSPRQAACVASHQLDSQGTHTLNLGIHPIENGRALIINKRPN
jgi:hypothetical protein